MYVVYMCTFNFLIFNVALRDGWEFLLKLLFWLPGCMCTFPQSFVCGCVVGSGSEYFLFVRSLSFTF
jgi:hypothetical protein